MTTVSQTGSVREVPFARPSIDDTDRSAVMRILEGHVLTHGPECKAFETDFSNFIGKDVAGNAVTSVTVSSCMAALHLSYLHLGLKPGDEVVVPAQTHVATAHAIEWVGAKPVFVDCDERTGNATAAHFERAITTKTKAIAVAHFSGIPCHMTDIAELAKKHNLAIVEDCATSVGAKWDGVHVGMFGDLACFSFYPVKHMTTAEGGMIMGRDAARLGSIARLRAFGVDRTHQERSVPGFYDAPTLGLNYRMSEMSAALGRTQLAKMPTLLAKRVANATRLTSALTKTDRVRVLETGSPRATNSHYCLVAVLDKKLGPHRNQIVAALNARGVGTSVYYPQPVPRMKFYQDKYGWNAAAFPNATRISDESIALPCGPHLSNDDVDYVASVVLDVVNGAS